MKILTYDSETQQTKKNPSPIYVKQNSRSDPAALKGCLYLENCDKTLYDCKTPPKAGLTLMHFVHKTLHIETVFIQVVIKNCVTVEEKYQLNV